MISKFFLITFCASMVLVVTSCSKEEEMGSGPADPSVSKNISIQQKDDAAKK